MLYRRSTNYRDGYIADADALMGEMFDCVDALNNIDQNNLQDNGLVPDRAIPSSAWTVGVASPSLTVGHNGGSILGATIGGRDPSLNLGEWVTSAQQGGTPGSFTVETVGRLRMRFYARGQYVNTGNLGIFDIRLLVDGEPRRIFTSSQTKGGAPTSLKIGWSVFDEAFLAPGSHSVQLQVRDRSQAAGTIYASATAPTAGHAFVQVIGFRP